MGGHQVGRGLKTTRQGGLERAAGCLMGAQHGHESGGPVCPCISREAYRGADVGMDFWGLASKSRVLRRLMSLLFRGDDITPRKQEAPLEAAQQHQTGIRPAQKGTMAVSICRAAVAIISETGQTPDGIVSGPDFRPKIIHLQFFTGDVVVDVLSMALGGPGSGCVILGTQPLFWSELPCFRSWKGSAAGWVRWAAPCEPCSRSGTS